MNLNDYQKQANETAIYPDKLLNLPYAVFGLVGEAGELANKLKKHLRGDPGHGWAETCEAVAVELGDVLWYVAMCALEVGCTLEDIATINLDKLAARKTKGTLQGDGDNR